MAREKVTHDSPGALYCSICNAYHPGDPCFKPTEAQRGEAVAIMLRYKDIGYVSFLTGKTVTQLQRWLMVYEGKTKASGDDRHRDNGKRNGVRTKRHSGNNVKPR